MPSQFLNTGWTRTDRLTDLSALYQMTDIKPKRPTNWHWHNSVKRWQTNWHNSVNLWTELYQSMIHHVSYYLCNIINLKYINDTKKNQDVIYIDRPNERSTFQHTYLSLYLFCGCSASQLAGLFWRVGEHLWSGNSAQGISFTLTPGRNKSGLVYLRFRPWAGSVTSLQWSIGSDKSTVHKCHTILFPAWPLSGILTDS